MTAIADQGLVAQRAGTAIPRHDEGTAPVAAARAAPAAPSIGNRTVIVYLLLSALLLLPGLVSAGGLQFSAGSMTAAALAELRAALSDIRFGSGLRFWLGVTGASMLSLMLLYPVRKALARGRGLGRIGMWFHLHIVLGFAGPVLILYHCNFGLGGTNANVALWSMLAVVTSGLAGQFIYTRASRDFYADKKAAAAHLDALRTQLSSIDAMHPAKSRLIDEFDAFDARQMMPRQGIAAALRNRLGVERWRRHFAPELARILAEGARMQGLPPGEFARARKAAAMHFSGYFRIARRASSRALREQLWARWRLFHLPIFLLMTAAVVLHVVAVWGMDPPATGAAARTNARADARIDARIDAPAPSGLKQLAVRTSRVDAIQSSAAADLPAPAASTPTAGPAPPSGNGGQSAGKDPGNGKPGDISALLATLPNENEPDNARPRPPSAVERAAPAPKLAVPPRPAAPALRQGPPRQTSPPPEPALAAGHARTAEGEGATRKPDQSRDRQDVPAPVAPTSDMTPVYAELKMAEPSLMGLGGARPSTLADQIAFLKAKLKAKEFHHSEAETGFALTGRHKAVDCADCHRKPLQDSRQVEVRQCIACHKADDVHRGRRPDCAQCHTPSRWSDIRKPRR